MLKNHKDLKYEFYDNLTELPANPESTAVLCLGKEPLLALAEHKLIPKNRTVTGLRLQPIALPGMTAKAIVSYNPGIADIDYGKYVDLQTDAGAAMRMSLTGSLDPQYGKYEYVENFKQFRAEVEALYAATGKPVESALDLETLGLDPYLKPALQHPGAYVVSIQLTHTVGTAQVVYFPSPKAEREWFADHELLADLTWILTTPKISTRGANLKYDLHWLHKRAGIYCTNFKFDTTLVGSLLDENRSNGLDVHCKIYAPELGGYSDVFDRTIDKARMDLVPKATLLPYAGGDSDATLRVSIAQKAELLKDKKLSAFYVNIMHPASRAFELMEQGGMLVDKKAYTELANDLNIEINSLVGKARTILGGRIWAKHSDPNKPGGLNLTKASMLQDYMFSPMGLNLKPRVWTDGSYDAAGNLKPDPTPSTALDNLLLFGDVPEAKAFVDLLADYSSAVKTKGTYVDGFLKHLRSDGRYHPSYYFFAGNKDEGDGGTNTGRLSCKAPAFQTIPKHTKWSKRLRRCYIAPDGYLVVERDYSQGELKVVACIANEQNMINAYLAGLDLHIKTGGESMGLTYAEMLVLKETNLDLFEIYRQRGKPGNFGLLYGMGAAGFKIYAESGYGVKITLDEAEAFRHKFLYESYPGLVEYHKAYKAFAHKHGHVRSPLGRIRHLPLINSSHSGSRSEAERQAVNSPVQGCLSDMLLWTTALEQAQGLTATMPNFGACHDAAYSYVHEDRIDQDIGKGMEIMQNLPFHLVGWAPQLQFTADAKYGKNMSDLQKWKAPA